MEAPRREPERSCVGCRRTSARRLLLRLARGPDGTVVVDPFASAPGRGAYVHRSQGCVASAFAKGAVFRALRAGADADAAARLRRDIERELRS